MNTNFSFKEKDKIIKALYKKYHDAQLDILYMNQHYNYYPETDMFKVKETTYQKADHYMLHQLDRKQYLEQYVKTIDQIQSHLSKKSFHFVENEYLNYYCNDWWLDLYSSATYYRMKHAALDELFESLSHFFDDEQLLKLIK